MASTRYHVLFAMADNFIRINRMENNDELSHYRNGTFGCITLPWSSGVQKIRACRWWRDNGTIPSQHSNERSEMGKIRSQWIAQVRPSRCTICHGVDARNECRFAFYQRFIQAHGKINDESRQRQSALRQTRRQRLRCKDAFRNVYIV